ncbi:YoaK family protein [Luteolibacter sp. AS25]|uniref:YoaK family protein n=1 Tax=Luteolibacter sp. AS25 TaxID=3135776 RepID=UPI00398AF2C3
MRQYSPTQLVLGGCFLAFGASFLNTGFILNTGTSVSHLTGDIAKIGAGISAFGRDDRYQILKVTVATLGFIFGATISGFLLHHPTLEIRMPYGRILAALGIFLVAAHFTFRPYPLLSITVASAVCGSQNALASRYRGIVLRTTHLTGLFTDFGIHLGMKLRGHSIEAWKLLVPVFITFSFLLGAITSSILILRYSENWILTAGIAYFISGALWSAYLYTRRNRQSS